MEKEITKEELLKSFEAIFNSFPKINNYDFLRENIFTLDGILETFFENYFRNVEGYACCCDKSSYVISKIKKALQEKKNLSLQEKYEDEDRIAYWCPCTIKNTDQAINLFYQTITFSSRKLMKESEIKEDLDY